ncbi:glycosyltransferase family 4 protein [Clostridium perfringens]|uniref:Glycosyltransferase family 1 protein n=1 Tax=Clostridium perfringens TaxID=1502 RepID=A0AAP4EF22_CLOPF|nr:glycosyltransferase family 1 protein [Clostridium perfringens]MDH2335629.1 glycosyltransferase family 1 protein [Clostridium perfringens]
MKICIDGRAATLYRGTGIGNYTYEIINNLHQIDFLNEYNILTPEASSLKLPKKNNFNYLSASTNDKKNFWEFINTQNPKENIIGDIYHIPQNGIGFSKPRDIKTVITLHDIIPMKMPDTVSETFLKIFNENIQNILDNSDGIITVSNFSKEDISKTFSYPKEKIFVTHLAAEEIYTPLNKFHSSQYLKKHYGIDRDFLLYVGGFSPRKNILGLIEAFNLVKNSYKRDLKLVIIGTKGPSYEIYRKKVDELNLSSSVIFTGFIPIDDMPIFYSASKALVYPSFYEGFGLPPIECMACGTPVIASNLTSMPEVCQDAALLVDPYDVDEIKENILTLLNNHKFYSLMIYKGLSHSSKFNWKKTAYNTLEVYKHISSQI